MLTASEIQDIALEAASAEIKDLTEKGLIRSDTANLDALLVVFAKLTLSNVWLFEKDLNTEAEAREIAGLAATVSAIKYVEYQLALLNS